MNDSTLQTQMLGLIERAYQNIGNVTEAHRSVLNEFPIRVKDCDEAYAFDNCLSKCLVL